MSSEENNQSKSSSDHLNDTNDDEEVFTLSELLDQQREIDEVKERNAFAQKVLKLSFFLFEHLLFLFCFLRM